MEKQQENEYSYNSIKIVNGNENAYIESTVLLCIRTKSNIDFDTNSKKCLI